jgi:hypothetical protein
VVLGSFAARDDRRDATCTRSVAIDAAVVPLVGDGQARLDVGSDIKRGLELDAVACLAAGQVKVERQALEVSLQMDLGRETATLCWR